MPLIVLERTYQEAFHDLGFSNFGKAIFLWLETDANRNMIRNLSLTPGDITGSFAKALAARQSSLDAS